MYLRLYYYSTGILDKYSPTWNGNERGIGRAGCCGGFLAQWFMAATVRHPGFKSCSCWFFSSPFLFSK